MQSQDEKGNIVQSVPVDISDMKSVYNKLATAKEKGAVKHVIANLPKKGGFIEVNGLSYKIEFADYVKGQFTIKMILR